MVAIATRASLSPWYLLRQTVPDMHGRNAPLLQDGGCAASAGRLGYQAWLVSVPWLR